MFWLILRAIIRADRTERSVYAQIETEERASDRRAAGPEQASEAHDFALVQREAHVAQFLGAAQALDAQELVARKVPGAIKPGAKEVARHGVPARDYQCLFDQAVNAGYALEWIDGFDVGGKVYYNAVFRPNANMEQHTTLSGWAWA